MPHNAVRSSPSLVKDATQSAAPTAAYFKPSYIGEVSPNPPIPTQGNAAVFHSFFPRHSSPYNLNVSPRTPGLKSREELRAILRSTRSEVAHLSRALRQQAEEIVDLKTEVEQQRQATLDAEAEAFRLSRTSKLVLEQNELHISREAVLLNIISSLYAKLDKENQTVEVSSTTVDSIEQERDNLQQGLERTCTGSPKPSSLSSLFSSFRKTILDLRNELYISNLNFLASDEERLRLTERVSLLQKNMEICVGQTSNALETERELRFDLERKMRLLVGRIAILKTSSGVVRERKSQLIFDVMEAQAFNALEPRESHRHDSKVNDSTEEEMLCKSETLAVVQTTKQWSPEFWKLPRNLFFHFPVRSLLLQVCADFSHWSGFHHHQRAGRRSKPKELLTRTGLAPATLTTPTALVHPSLAAIITGHRFDGVSMNPIRHLFSNTSSKPLGRSLFSRLKEWLLIGGTYVLVRYFAFFLRINLRVSLG
jgi:hypothetical protein